jgi:hypothetical protein
MKFATTALLSLLSAPSAATKNFKPTSGDVEKLLNVTDATDFLQGQNFLGHGYNAIYANPIVGDSGSGGAPEGLTKAQSIFKFVASDNTVKWNGNNYVCPLGVDCDVYNSCGSTTTSFSAHGAKSMQEALKGSVSFATGGWFPGSFTASASYQSTVSSMEENSYHYFYADATCAMYHLKLKSFTSDLTLSSEFETAVAYLDVSNDDTFYDVIEAFGTHYTSALVVGGQATKYDYFEEEYYESATATGMSFDEDAKVSFAMFSVSGEFSETKREECTEEYDSKSSGGSAYYVGGGAWAESIADWYATLVEDESLAPLGSGMEVTPLFSLLTSTYFPQDVDIAEKATKMEEMLQNYCRLLDERGETCVEEPEDIIPPADRIKQSDLEGGPNNTFAAEVAIGTDVYRFGGLDGYFECDITAKYDAIMGKWDEAAVQTFPEIMSSMGVAAVGTDIYLFGGYSHGYTSTVRKYDTLKDSYAVMAPTSHRSDDVRAATVSLSSSALIYYGAMNPNPSDFKGFYKYDVASDTHSTISTDLQVNCLASSTDGTELFGVTDNYLNKFDPSNGLGTKVSEEKFPSSMYSNRCAMTTSGLFYFITNDEIWYMDTSSKSDMKWYKAGNIDSHHQYAYGYYSYSAVMIQDILLITSLGYTEAFDTTSARRLEADE